MSKYFDKLVKMNESLNRELRHKGLVTENVDPNNEMCKRIRKAGLSVGYNTKGIEVSYTADDERESRAIFDRLCASCGIADLVEGVTTEKMLTGEYVTYGNVLEKNVVAENGDKDEISIPKDALTDDQKKDILVDKGVDKKTVDAMKDPDEISSALDATLNNDNVEQKNESMDEAVVMRIDDNDLEVHGYIKMGIDNKVKFVDNEDEADVFDTKKEAEIVKQEICDTCSFDPDTITFQNAYPQDEDNGENWMALDPAHPGATTTK